MVSEDKMQEEIDKATVALGMQQELDLYSILLRIKYAKDREEVINREVKVCRAKLEHAWQVDKKVLDDLEVECEKIGGEEDGSITKTRRRISNKTNSFLLGSGLLWFHVWRENWNRKQYHSGMYSRDAFCSGQ